MRPKPPSLLNTLLRRLGKRVDAPKDARPVRPFQSVSIFRGMQACEMARGLSEHRFLAREAPPLPLAGCTQRASCECRYIKHGDRRSDPRRLEDFASAQRFRGLDRRMRDRRRAQRD